jgi:hypothetical protein
VRSPELAKTTLAALPVIVATPLIGLGLWVLKPWSASSSRFSVSAAFAAVVPLLLLGFFALTRKRLPRAGAAAAVGTIPWVLVVAWCVVERLTTALVYADSGLRCGTGSAMLLILLGPIGLLVTFIGSVGMSAVATERAFDRVLRPASKIALALGAIALAFAAAKHGRPDADTYIDSLPVTATLAPGESIVIAGRAHLYASKELPTTRAPEQGGDELPPSPGPIGGRECVFEGVQDARQPATLYGTVNACPPIQVRVDPAGDLAIVLSSELRLESLLPASGPEWTPRVAFRTADAQAIDLKLALVSDRIAPPFGWRFGALVGTVTASVLLLLARSIRRRAAANDARAAHHRGDGWCDLPDSETPLRVPAAASLPIGPVMLHSSGDGAPTYREAGGPTFTSARVATIHTETDRAAALEAIALSASVLGVVPLLLARLWGI